MFKLNFFLIFIVIYLFFNNAYPYSKKEKPKYIPKCAYFLGCPKIDKNNYNNWSNDYIRKTDKKMKEIVIEENNKARLRAIFTRKKQ